MSGKRAWPHRTGVDLKYDRCVYALGRYWWAYKHPHVPHFVEAVPAHDNGGQAPQRLWAGHIQDTLHFSHASATATPAQSTQLYSAVGVSPVGMFWVKQPTGPIETLRAPYEEILALVKKLAEKYPDTTYTVVKVCAEVRTPPKPTLEVKEY